MFEKLNEVKVFRDPIHGYIHVEYKLIWDAIASKEFQRLRRIKQQGSSYVVYHTAEHSRFGHSLGVYEIVRRMCNEVKDIAGNLSQEEKIIVMLAGLLHDLGHGPFSHTFEAVSDVNHEIFTARILEEDSEIHRVLENAKEGLSLEVSKVIKHTHPNLLLTQMVSGQLDADRMDYLLRDAYFTGTKYGEFDLERILRTMRVRNNMIIVKESGVHSIEDYIMARYHMYWQVYYHPVARAFESIIYSLFDRMKVLYKNKDIEALNGATMFIPFISGESISLLDHYLLDEAACFYGFKLLASSSDEILKDLAIRILNRDLFDYIDIIDETTHEYIKTKVKDAGYDINYYVKTDTVMQRPYKPLSNESIWLLLSNGEIRELSKGSYIVSSISKGKSINDNKVFFPKNII